MRTVKKILILSANPKDTARLRLDEEVREIDEGLRRSKHRDQFVIQSRWAVRLRDIRRAILDYEPQIVHFCGHGDEDGLKVEDDIGNSIFIHSGALSSLFELFAEQIECVLLNACYSAAQAEAINKHINYVIGMRQSVRDKISIEFTVGFYDALGAGKTVEEAFKFGSSAIQIFNIPGHLAPILLEKKSVNPQVGQKTVLGRFGYGAKPQAEVNHFFPKSEQTSETKAKESDNNETYRWKSPGKNRNPKKNITWMITIGLYVVLVFLLLSIVPYFELPQPLEVGHEKTKQPIPVMKNKEKPGKIPEEEKREKTVEKIVDKNPIEKRQGAQRPNGKETKEPPLTLSLSPKEVVENTRNGISGENTCDLPELKNNSGRPSYPTVTLFEQADGDSEGEACEKARQKIVLKFFGKCPSKEEYKDAFHRMYCNRLKQELDGRVYVEVSIEFYKKEEK